MTTSGDSGAKTPNTGTQTRTETDTGTGTEKSTGTGKSRGNSGKPGQNSVYHIVLLAFDGSNRAQAVLNELKGEQSLDSYVILAHAVVQRDGTGKVTIHEPGHGGVAGTAGAVAGGLLGLFGGPMAVIGLAIAGGAVGGIAGHFAGRVIPVEELERIGDALPNNSSGLVILAEDLEAERLIGNLEGYQANVVTITLGDELSGEIAAAIGGDVTPTDAGTAAKATSSATDTSARAQGGAKSTGSATGTSAPAQGAAKPADANATTGSTAGDVPPSNAGGGNPSTQPKP